MHSKGMCRGVVGIWTGVEIVSGIGIGLGIGSEDNKIGIRMSVGVEIGMRAGRCILGL